MLVAAFEYDDDPQRLDQYVSVDEVSGLLEIQGRPFRKDTKRLVHFLTRLRLTLLAFRQQVQHLHRDVQAANIRATSIGTPTSLDPRSAARFLPPEEIAALADELIKQKLSAIEETERKVAAERADTLRRLNSLKFAVSSIQEDFAIPADVRARIATAFDGEFDSLPSDPAPAPAPSDVQPSNEADSSLDDLFE